MDSRFRLLTAACAVVFLAGVVASFTVGDSDQDVAADEASTPNVEADSSTSTTTAATPEEPGEPGEATSTSAAPTTDSTSDDTAPDAPGPTTTAIAAPPTTVPVGVTATTPGTYVYDISGCCDPDGKRFSGTSKLTVPEPDGNGRQAQTQSGPEGSSTTTYRFTPEGMYLESMSMSAQGQSFTLTAVSPFLVIPAGAQVGTTSSGQLRGSGITADVTFSLAELGPDVAVAEIEARLSGKVGGLCSVNGTMKSTIRARSSDQLPLETTSETRVKACIADMNSNSRSVLRS